MRTLHLFVACILFSIPTFAQYRSSSTFGSTNSSTGSHYTNGYIRQNGTVVEGYYSTPRNNTNLDNYSTTGNINSYTGESGHRAPDYSSAAQNYGQGRVIHEGPRGGQYYYNENGGKTYVPKQ